jgi:hypothetical protein
MSPAEIMFRIAAPLGGWLIFVAHALTLLALTQVECDPSAPGHAPGTAFFAVLSGLALTLVGFGLPWRAGFRWIAYPAAALAAIAAWKIAPTVSETTLAGIDLCRSLAFPTPPHFPSPALDTSILGRPASSLERAWPVLQLLVLGGAVIQALRHAAPRERDRQAEPVRHRSGDT